MPRRLKGVAIVLVFPIAWYVPQAEQARLTLDHVKPRVLASSVSVGRRRSPCTTALHEAHARLLHERDHEADLVWVRLVVGACGNDGHRLSLRWPRSGEPRWCLLLIDQHGSPIDPLDMLRGDGLLLHSAIPGHVLFVEARH